MQKEKSKVFEIVIFVVIVIIIGALLLMVSNNKGKNDNEHIKNISYSEYKEKLKSDDYTVVLLVRPGCGYCNEYKPFVNEIALEYKVIVNYLDVSKLNENERKELHDSVKLLKDAFDEEGNISILTPITILYRSGIEIDSEMGNVGYNGFLDLLKRNGVVKNG